jgi:hypothetical protein
VHQPNALQQIDEKHRSRDKLRRAESLVMKKSLQHFRNRQTECFNMSETVLVN